MFSGSSMKKMFMIVVTAALSVLCHDIPAVAQNAEESPAVALLGSNKDTRRIEGMMLRMARPILKKTPMSAVLDDIEMMMMCPVGKISRKDNGKFVRKVENVLKDYMLVHEINDELSRMFIYVYGLEGNRFPELVLYITSPDPNVLLFRGDFTEESLRKVGELSEQDRKVRIKAKRSKGQDDSYLQYIK